MSLSYTIEGQIIRFTVVGDDSLDDLKAAAMQAINDARHGDQPLAVRGSQL